MAMYVVASCVLALQPVAAISAPPENADPTLSEWFNSLTAPDTSVPCCDLSDCRRAASRRGPGGWEAWIDGQWMPVPGEKVLTDAINPTSRAIVCWSPGLGLMCFVPPPMRPRPNFGS